MANTSKPPSARTLVNRANRIHMYRESLDALTLGMADGLLAMGEQIIADAAANAPRDAAKAAARGVPMMADTGFVQVWALGKRAGGTWQEKPRRVSIPKDQAVLFVGFNSPLAHFAEMGTVKETARPFLIPAFNRGLPNASSFVVPAMGARMRYTGLSKFVAEQAGFKVGAEGGIQGVKR